MPARDHPLSCWCDRPELPPLSPAPPRAIGARGRPAPDPRSPAAAPSVKPSTHRERSTGLRSRQGSRGGVAPVRPLRGPARRRGGWSGLERAPKRELETTPLAAVAGFLDVARRINVVVRLGHLRRVHAVLG